MILLSKYKNNDVENLDFFSTKIIENHIKNFEKIYSGKNITTIPSRYSPMIGFQYKKVYLVNVIEWKIFCENDFLEKIRKTIDVNGDYVEIRLFKK